MTEQDWIMSVAKDATVSLLYVHESHVEWEGTKDGWSITVTATIPYGPKHVFDRTTKVSDLMPKSESVYVTMANTRGQRYEGELLGGSGNATPADFANVTYLPRRAIR